MFEKNDTFRTVRHSEANARKKLLILYSFHCIISGTDYIEGTLQKTGWKKMPSRTVIANRNDFFPRNGCPIALRTIQGDAPIQHEGDLTDLRHTHDFAELIIITGGGGLHWINGETYPVSAGDIFLIQGNTEHYFKRRHNLEMFNIMFDDSYLKEHLHTLRSLSGFNAFFLFFICKPGFKFNFFSSVFFSYIRYNTIYVSAEFKTNDKRYHILFCNITDFVPLIEKRNCIFVMRIFRLCNEIEVCAYRKLRNNLLITIKRSCNYHAFPYVLVTLVHRHGFGGVLVGLLGFFRLGWNIGSGFSLWKK